MTHTTEKQGISTLIPIPRRGIGGIPGTLLHILLGLSAVMMPLGISAAFDKLRIPPMAVEIYSVILLVLISVYFFRTGKIAGKASRGFLPILIFGSLLLIYLTRSAVIAAMCFSLIFYMGEGAVLLATQSKKSLSLFPLVPLLAFGVSAVVCQGLDIALLSILPLPATVALAMGTRSSAAKETGLTRIGVICLTSLCLGITAVGFAAWFLYQSLGSLDIPTLQNLLENIRTELTLRIMDVHFETSEGMMYPFEGKETLISDVVAVTINILPGVFVALCNVIAATAQMMTLSGLVAFGFGESVTGRVKQYQISVVSSFVFLLSWIVAWIANAETSTLIGTVAENFTILLLPGMALAGLLRFLRMLARKGCAPGCLLFFVLIIPGVSAYIFMILSIYEAIAAVFGPLVAKLKPPRDDDDIFPPPKDDNDHRDDTDS